MAAVVTFAAVLLGSSIQAALLQSQPLPSQPCGRGLIKPFKYGDVWLGQSLETRVFWIEGFIDGAFHLFRAWEAETHPPPSKREQMRRALLPLYDSLTLEPVMTALYKDPANVFITSTAMLYVAKAQLNGEDIAPMLRYSRQNDCTGSLVSPQK